MNRFFALLPAAGLVAGSILAAATLMTSSAAAQACQLDNGGGCLREGMKCSPPQKGKCKTERVGTRELRCVCATGSSTRPDRSERPTGQPTEPQEPPQPQEETPQG